MSLNQNLETVCKEAKKTKYVLQNLNHDKKNEVLFACADALIVHENEILDANAFDIDCAVQKGISGGLIDRLRLTNQRIYAMAEGLKQIADLPDPIGEIMEELNRPNGLQIKKVRVPIGVIGIIYESRPNVTSDAFGLCFKSGNVVILKGGSDAIHTNKKIVSILQDVLRSFDLPQNLISLIQDTSRETAKAFMKMNQYVDLLIPRGGAGLIRSVIENSTIPVIETGTGNCHIYVDEFADINMAIDIIYNAKTQRISVCNACESLVIHEKILEKIMPLLDRKLSEKNVEIFGDDNVCALIPDAKIATETDYKTEYLDYKLSVKTVSSIEQAIEHINRYNTGHSEAIISQDEARVTQFLNQIDAACVYANASTRFTDGFEFGYGAEIGISTQMLHARGPMGLRELTSYKYNIIGSGQIRK